MGVLAYFASTRPEARMQIAFVPAFSFSADAVSCCFNHLRLAIFILSVVAGLKRTSSLRHIGPPTWMATF